MAWMVKAWVRVSEEHISEEVHETVESFVGPFTSRGNADFWREVFLNVTREQNISVGADKPIEMDTPWEEDHDKFLSRLSHQAQEALREKLNITDELPF